MTRQFKTRYASYTTPCYAKLRQATTLRCYAKLRSDGTRQDMTRHDIPRPALRTGRSPRQFQRHKATHTTLFPANHDGTALRIGRLSHQYKGTDAAHCRVL